MDMEKVWSSGRDRKRECKKGEKETERGSQVCRGQGGQEWDMRRGERGSLGFESSQPVSFHLSVSKHLANVRICVQPLFYLRVGIVVNFQ